VRIYLDVSCLNRPFDNQGQARIRLESEAVAVTLEACDRGEYEQVSSEMAEIEIDAMPDTERRARVRLLLPRNAATLKLTPAVLARAADLEKLGFKPADAVHVAAAEALAADVCLSCDDRMCRTARRRRAELRVRVENPLTWLNEVGDDADAG
jgi:predicted nucleic acid-binding protein